MVRAGEAAQEEGLQHNDAARYQGRPHLSLRKAKERADIKGVIPIERVFAVLKRSFSAGHVMVTTLPRVKVKMMFSYICFNLMQMLTLLRQVQG
jgi:IS5 family transposase